MRNNSVFFREVRAGGLGFVVPKDSPDFLLNLPGNFVRPCEQFFSHDQGTIVGDEVVLRVKVG
jgi:hypothetical protein